MPLPNACKGASDVRYAVLVITVISPPLSDPPPASPPSGPCLGRSETQERVHYSYNPTASADFRGTRSAIEPCHGEKDKRRHCFATWRNVSGVVEVVKQGCWLDDISCYDRYCWSLVLGGVQDDVYLSREYQCTNVGWVGVLTEGKMCRTQHGKCRAVITRKNIYLSSSATDIVRSSVCMLQMACDSVSTAVIGFGTLISTAHAALSSASASALFSCENMLLSGAVLPPPPPPHTILKNARLLSVACEGAARVCLCASV